MMNENGITSMQHSALPNTASAGLALPSSPGCDNLATLAHDARNLITALNLYCDLLNGPGVLAPPFRHYGNELRMVTAAGRRLVSKLSTQSEHDFSVSPAAPAAPIEPMSPEVESTASCSVPSLGPLARRQSAYTRFDDEFAATPITNLAAELLASRNLLAALVGPATVVTVDVEGGACGIRLTAEDLTRILVNLARNSAEAMSRAMSSNRRIQISLSETSPAGTNPVGFPVCLHLIFEDNGPGISPELIHRVFDQGFTTHSTALGGESWITFHRGLGLAIARSIIQSAGGRIEVATRPGGGARFSIELPGL
jgi:signal transduction histidine kinase